MSFLPFCWAIEFVSVKYVVLCFDLYFIYTSFFYLHRVGVKKKAGDERR